MRRKRGRGRGRFALLVEGCVGEERKALLQKTARLCSIVFIRARSSVQPRRNLVPLLCFFKDAKQSTLRGGEVQGSAQDGGG